MAHNDDIYDYQQLKGWLKGKKRSLQGRVRRRGDTHAPKLSAIAQCYIAPRDGLITQKNGKKIHYTIQQVFLADGWAARYTEDDGSTFEEAIPFFALVTMTMDEETRPGIIGLDYTPEGGWSLLADYDNLVELLPPE